LRELKQSWTSISSIRRLAHLTLRRNWESAKSASQNPLLRCGQKYFSQFDEDGILLEILRRLGVDSGRFIEVGVGDGSENNTIILLAHGWSGLWIGAEPLIWRPSGRRLVFRQSFITVENASELVGNDHGDVFSLDIDGNDYWIAKAILPTLRPRVVIVEYNAKFPPPVRFVMPYDPGHRWDKTDYCGASLAAWADLLVPHGYFPVCCSYQGTNVFFVRIEDREQFADVPSALADLYRPADYFAPFETGHPASPKTLVALERQ
jgi:hypothetical protein